MQQIEAAKEFDILSYKGNFFSICNAAFTQRLDHNIQMKMHNKLYPH